MLIYVMHMIDHTTMLRAILDLCLVLVWIFELDCNIVWKSRLENISQTDTKQILNKTSEFWS